MKRRVLEKDLFSLTLNAHGGGQQSLVEGEQ